MADLDFPLNPQVNDLYTLNDRTFRYDGAKWRYISLSLVTVTSGTAVTSINSLTNSAQVFSVGSSGSGFNISSSGLTHTFNIPIAGSGSTGLITTQTQTIAGAKTFSSDLLVSSSTASTNTTTGALSVSGGAAIGGSLNVAGRINLWNSTNCTSFVSSASGNTVYTLPATSPATGTSVLQSDTTGVLSWVPMTATGGIAVSGAVDGSIQFKSGSGLGATRSFTINPNHFGIRLGNFPGSTTTTNSAALLIEQSIGSFIGSTSGTLIGVSASTGFTGDWISIQVNSVSKYKMDNTGAIIHDVGTASTSTSTGALVVTGGVGIGGSLHVASATAISGVTINAGVITGSLTGTATTATYSNQSGYATTSGIASTSQSINTVSANTLATHYLLFSPVDGGSGVAVSSDTNLTYNPSTNVITTNTFSGNLSATAVTSTNFYGTLTGNVTGTATSAQNVNVVAANTNSNHPVLFTPTSGSASGVAVSSESSFVYNPSTDILSVSGLAVTSSTASTSSSTGSLIVTGGAGIGRTLNIGGRATIGSTDFGATLSLSAQNTGLKSLVIRKLASQSANTFEIQDADGNALISTSFNAGSGQTGSGVLNIHANRDVGDASSETVFAVKNGSNNVFRIGRNGDLGFFSTLQGGDGAGSYETIFQNIYGSRVNWQKLVWFSGSGFNFINAGANFVNNSSQLAISNAGTTSVTGVMVIANGWDTGGGTRVFGIGTPGSGERSYFKGYGNLVINPNNPNSLHAAWNTMDLITMDISGTATTFAGNIILGKVEGTERFSVGPFGNTKISVGTATTATGLIVKAVASQTGNLLETQSSSGTTNFYITPSGSVSIGATTISTSTTTGALLVTGGVGIGGSLYVTSATAISGITINSGVITGSLTGTATTATYSLQSGYGITAGIATTSNNVNVVAATSNSFHRVLFTPASGTASGAAVSTESSFVYNPSTDILTISGLAVTSQTSSTNTSSGALIVSGGVGVGGTIFAGGLNIQDIFTLGSQIFYPQNTRGFSVNENYNPVGSGASHTAYHFTSGVGRASIYFDLAISNQYTVMFGTYGSAAGNTFVIGSETANSDFEFRSTLGIQPVRLDLGTLLMRISRSGNVSIPASTTSTSTSTGALSVSGGVGIGQSVSVGGRLQLFNSSNYTAFVSSASGNTVYTLPATTPSTGSSVLQSTSAGVMSWVPMTASGGLAISGSTDGTVQFKSGSSLGATNSLFFDTSLLGLRVSGFPGGSSPTSTDAALKVEQTVSSFNGSTSGTMIAVNANTGFAGDLINLQVNAVSKFRIDNTGAIIQNIGTNSSSTTSGAVQVRGGVGITGAVYVGESVNATSLTQSTSTTSGSLVVSGGAGIGQSISIGGRLQLFNSSNYTAFVSSASGNTVYTLPATSPATGSSVLQSTSAGVMSWVAMTAGSSSGNTSQNIAVNAAGNPNTFHPVLFTPSSLSAGSAISSDSTIAFNPSTEILHVSGLAITSGTASTNTTTGALVVRGGLGVTGQLSFATASFGFTGITTNPIMSFIGATSSSPITLTVQNDNSLNWEGSQGSVFSIDSNLSTGEIFSVSDISGLPIISASAGQTVNINEFGGYTQIGNGTLNSSSTTTGALVVSGGLGITGNANIGGTVRITNTTVSSSSSTGSLVVSGGVGISGTLNVGLDLGISGLTTLTYTSEKLNTKTSAGSAGTVTHDLSTGSIFYHSSISNNFTANFTNVPTTNDRAIGVTLILAQGVTPYMSTVLQLDGSTQTIKWVNNTTPTGTASKVDIVGFSLIRTGSAWTVLGQYSTYG